MRTPHVLLASFSLVVVGCVSIAGIGDFAVDPCFDGCKADAGSTPDVVVGNDGPIGNETSTVDAPADVAPDAPPPSPGLSSVATSGTGVAVGKAGVVTLVTKNATGDVVPRTGAKVVFTTTGGTSVLSFGAVADLGGGTYRATYTGVAEGTKVQVSATLDGAPLTTAPASVRVANVVSSGLTFSLDVESADRAGNFGGKGCAASGLGTWKDLTATAFTGTLTNFGAVPCAAGSGWNGAGNPDDPFRLAFDGVDDYVDFGPVNSITKQTVIAWVRKTGDGFTGTSGSGGLTNVTPIVTKGTAEGESEPIDINFYLGIADTGELATDYEATGTSANAPLKGATVLTNATWYMVAMTLDAAAGQRFLYVNGKQDAMSAITAAPGSGSASILTVGGARRSDGAGSVTCPGAMGSTGCGRFKGEIAAVLTYNRALSVAEIESNCHSLSSRFGMLSCPN
ncbi:MAG: hypothetical protein JST00_47270 [Deltaproteobacteria bacterium]|nr:hypothetical protein [Deltaproteobacteria bacterium]